MRSDAVLERLQGLHPRLIDLSLGRIRRVLAALGDPQDRLPPVVHVAGTNGKGSTVAFLRAFAEAAGLDVHAYTSPHLVRFHERVVLAGETIGDDVLVAALETAETANAGAPITFFEITTAAAFHALAGTPADLVLIETGLGGRFDATNVVDRPALAAITPIAMDHMHYLGDTLEAIAFEKAGIVKPGVPCAVGPQAPGAAAVIAARAAALGAPLIVHGADWRVSQTEAGFAYEDGLGRFELPPPPLRGRHQLDNAGLAIACAHRLGMFPLDRDTLARGLAATRWPARLQRLERGRLAARLPAGWELWLDGAHNAAAASVIADFVAGWPDRPLHLVVGLLNNRDPRDFLPPLAPRAATLCTVTIPGVESSARAEDIAAAAREIGVEIRPAEGVEAALDAIVAGALEPGRILICGSLYLAGHVLALDGG